MAQRSVSIRVALTGYDEYRATVSKLNQQNKLLESELRMVDAEYRNTGNASEYTRQKAEVLAKEYDNHVQKLKAIQTAIVNANKDIENYSHQMQAAEEKVQQATKALEDAKASGTATKEEIQALTEAQAKANIEYAEAKAKYEAATKGLNELEIAANNERTAINNVEKAMKDNNETMDEAPPKMERVVDVMAEMLLAEKVAEYIGKIKDALWECIDASMSYEQAFTNVTKTVNGTEEDFAKLDKDIREMASRLPQSADEIAEVASIAGQLGVRTEDISRFTETMLGLGTATNMTAEEAATLLAQFQNVTKFDSSKIANVASVIVDLGNNSATTEANIMNMAQRLAAAGANMGLTAPQILGISAALSSVGINAEAGGSSISKMFTQIDRAVNSGGTALEDYARISGTTAEQFAKVWREEPVEAIQMFITGLGTGSQTASQFLDEMGINEVRLRNSLLSLANGEDILRQSVERANGAFRDTSALDTEVSRFLETTQSKSEILKNNVDLLKVAIGDSLKPAIESMISTAIPLVQQITEFIQKNPEVVQGITLIVGAIGAMTGAIVAYKAAVTLANTVTAVFGTTLTATPVGAVVAAVVGLTAAIGLYIAANKEATEELQATRLIAYDASAAIDEVKQSFDETMESMDYTNTIAEKYLDRLDELDKKTELTNDEQAEYNKLLERLQELYPELNIEIDKKTGKIKDGTQAIRDQIKAYQDRVRAEAYHDVLLKYYETEIDLNREANKLIEEGTRLENERSALVAKQNELQDKRREITDKMHGASLSQWFLLKSEYDEVQAELDEITGKVKEYDAAIAENNMGLDANRKEHEKLQSAIDETSRAVVNAEHEITKVQLGDNTAFKNYVESMRQAILDGIPGAKAAARQLASEVKNSLKSNLGTIKYNAKVTSGSAGNIGLTLTAQAMAKGGIVSSPTLAVFGEAGREAVLPIEKLEPMIVNAMAMYEASKERSKDKQAYIERIVREEPVDLVGEFKKALSEMKVELDDNEVGAFVDRTVTDLVYS